MMLKKHLPDIGIALVFIIGFSILLYPFVANLWNERHATTSISNYQEVVENITPEEYQRLFSDAETYNKTLKELSFPLVDYYRIDGYEEALSVDNSGIMGYITIPKLKVNLPIYHTVSEAVLSVGVGHMEGTTLPIGGDSTHSVLSSHTGLPSAQLFTNLNKMEVGDTFTIQILDRTLTYEVDDIKVTLPEETNYLLVQDGRDLVTLLTCTPYGINTHRLLITGHRIPNPEVTEEVGSKNLFDYLSNPFVIALIVLGVILFASLVYLIRRRRKLKKLEKMKEENNSDVERGESENES